MFNSRYFYSDRCNFRQARRGLAIVVVGLVSGCASQPPLTSAPSHALTEHATHNKAAYNQPYHVKGKTYYPMATATGYSEQGLASWYGNESGNRTAMGTHFKAHGYSAAHKTLPLPSKVRVTNLHNGRSIVVIVNDRGPFKKNRLIDLSHGAAKEIGLHGLSIVKVEYVGG